jgi:hypothetical protein
MAVQPIGTGSRIVAASQQWYASSTCNRSYVVASLRAVVIALVLLGVLALIILT